MGARDFQFWENCMLSIDTRYKEIKVIIIIINFKD